MKFIRTTLKKVWLSLKIITSYKNWYLFFLHTFHILPPRNVIYKTNAGLFYKCRMNSTDFGILNEIVIFKEYGYYDHEIAADMQFVDFGAQAGAFSLYYAQKYHVYVESFEPESSNYKLLAENIALNNLESRVTTHNLAVGTVSGKTKLFLSGNSNHGIHSLYKKTNSSVDVDVVDLNAVLSIVKRPIDMLKIDIEGSEHEILDIKFIDFYRQVRRMVLEYHVQSHFENVKSLDHITNTIQTLGFKIDKIQGTREIGIISAKRDL